MTAQKANKKELSFTVPFDEIILTSNGLKHKPKHLPRGTEVAVDKSNFYIGNYKTSWKDVNKLVVGNTGFNFLDEKENRFIDCSFEEPKEHDKAWIKFEKFISKKWEKLEAKKGAELALERSKTTTTKATSTKRGRTTYGSRRKKKHETRATIYSDDEEDDNDHDDDEDEWDSRPSWSQRKKQKKESVMEDEAEDEGDDVEEAELEEEVEENQASEAEEEEVPQPSPLFKSNKTPQTKGRQLGGKGKSRRISLDEPMGSDTDEDVDMTTPAAETQRVVTPFDKTDAKEEVDSTKATKAKKGGIDTFFKPLKQQIDTGSTVDTPMLKSPVASKAPASTKKSFSPRSVYGTTLPKSPLASKTLGTASTKKSFSPKSFASSPRLSPKPTATGIGTPNLTPASDIRTNTPKLPPTTASKSTSVKRTFSNNSDDEKEDDNRSPLIPSPQNLTQSGRPSHTLTKRRGPTYSSLPKNRQLIRWGPNNNNNNNNKSPRTTSPPPREETKAASETEADELSYTGLKNMGNTCYMNSSLQMLFTVKPFVDSIEGKGGELIKSVVSIARKVEGSGFYSVTPRVVKMAIDSVTDKFEGYNQCDAHEFLGDLIDNIQEEMVEERKWNKQVDDDAKPTPTQDSTADDGKPHAKEMPKDQKEESKTEDKIPDSSTDPTSSTEKEPEDGANVAPEPDESMVVDEASTSTPTLETERNDLANDDKDMATTSDPSSETTPAEQEKYPTDEFFRCDIEVCLTCNNCSYSRTKREMYRHLSLDIEHHKNEDKDSPESVKKSLEHFFQAEERELKCEKCNVGTTASQTLKLLNRPKALLLHLKRFIVDQNMGRDGTVDITMRKNQSPVELSQKISLDAFRGDAKIEIENEAVNESCEYSLKSIVNHVGNRASSGHYTAHAMRPLSQALEDDESNKKSTETEWVYFDDSKGRSTQPEAIACPQRQKNAYMLLYTLD